MAINRVGYLHVDVDVNVVRSAESAEVTVFFPCVLAPLAASDRTVINDVCWMELY